MESESKITAESDEMTAIMVAVMDKLIEDYPGVFGDGSSGCPLLSVGGVMVMNALQEFVKREIEHDGGLSPMEEMVVIEAAVGAGVAFMTAQNLLLSLRDRRKASVVAENN